MSGGTGGAARAASAPVVLFCNALFGAGRFVPAHVAGQEAPHVFGTPDAERGVRAGFAEVSDDWQGWLEGWRDSTVVTFRVWGARVAATYSTEDEVLGLYRFRARWFTDVADDATRNAVCGASALTDESVPASDVDLGPVPRLVGRGFARRHVGQKPWVPPVDLRRDEDAWAAFADYLIEGGEAELLETLVSVATGVSLPNRQMCRLQGALYRLASEHPRDLVGSVRLLDFVRALDSLGASGSPSSAR